MGACETARVLGVQTPQMVGRSQKARGTLPSPATKPFQQKEQVRVEGLQYDYGLALSPSVSVTLGKALNHSEPPSPICKMGTTVSPAP